MNKISQMSMRNSTPYILIALIITIFNLVGIFGLNILINDDQSRYISAITNTFPWGLIERSFITPFINYAVYELMTISPDLARLSVVLFFMVPLSCIAYYCYRFIFSLPVMVAFTAAVLPNILPGQTMLPVYLDMSHYIYGTSFAILGFVLGFYYLKNNQIHNNTGSNKILLILASLIYFSSTHMMDQSIFLLIPFLFSFYYFSKINSKFLLIAVLFSVIAGAKGIWAILNPWATNTPLLLTWSDIAKRTVLYFEYSLPYPSIALVSLQSHRIFYIFISLLIIALGFLIELVFRKTNDKWENKYGFTEKGFFSVFTISQIKIHAYIFSVVWAITSIVPFIFLSPYYGSRYAYISSFGINLLLILSLYSIINFVFGRFNKQIVFVLFLSIIIVSGFSNYIELQKRNKIFNPSHAVILENLKKHDFPKDSQIVIIGGTSAPTGGYWRWSSGYLKFTTKRSDINGILPYEYNYYNPFNPKERGYEYKMRGLDLNQPIFLFKPKLGFKQLEYALQWGNAETKESKWTIFHFDKISGIARIFLSGQGWTDYQNTLRGLKEEGLMPEGILWGGEPNHSDKMRLRLN